MCQRGLPAEPYPCWTRKTRLEQNPSCPSARTVNSNTSSRGAHLKNKRREKIIVTFTISAEAPRSHVHTEVALVSRTTAPKGLHTVCAAILCWAFKSCGYKVCALTSHTSASWSQGPAVGRHQMQEINGILEPKMRRHPSTSTEALFPSAVTQVIVSELCSLSVFASLRVKCAGFFVVQTATVGRVLTEETTSSSLRGNVGRAQGRTMACCMLPLVLWRCSDLENVLAQVWWRPFHVRYRQTDLSCQGPLFVRGIAW